MQRGCCGHRAGAFLLRCSRACRPAHSTIVPSRKVWCLPYLETALASPSNSTVTGTVVQTAAPSTGLTRASLEQVQRRKSPKSSPRESMRDVPAGDLKQLQCLVGLGEQSHLSNELQDAVLVCFDCEAYEFNQRKVTEVGVSCVDTRHIRSLPPGINGDSWLPFIKTSHYRIKEYRHLRNREFAKGNPDSFAFGKSVSLRLADASSLIRSVIQTGGGHAVQQSRSQNVVIVGHSLKSDLAYLQSLGLNVLELSNVVLKLDTQSIATPKTQRPGLRNLLTALEIQAVGLHNAGNDAHHTLRALLAMAVREHNLPGSVSASLPQPAQPADKASKSKKKQRKAMRMPLQSLKAAAAAAAAAGSSSPSTAQALTGAAPKGSEVSRQKSFPTSAEAPQEG